MSLHHRPVGTSLPTFQKMVFYSTLSMAVAAILLVTTPALAAPAADNQPVTTQSGDRPMDGEKGLRTSAKHAADMPAGLYKASALIGMDVRDRTGSSIGEIKDMALDPGQENVRYAVLSFGGVLGVGDKSFAVPLSAFEPGNNYDALVLNVSEKHLDDLKGFDDDHWPASVAGYWPGSDERSASGDSHSSAAGPIVKASDYLDLEVENAKGEDLGEIEDLAIELSSGRIKYVVIEHGGLLGVGEKLIAVPVSALSSAAYEDGVILNATDDELKNAKGFSDDHWPSQAEFARFEPAGDDAGMRPDSGRGNATGGGSD